MKTQRKQLREFTTLQRAYVGYIAVMLTGGKLAVEQTTIKRPRLYLTREAGEEAAAALDGEAVLLT